MDDSSPAATDISAREASSRILDSVQEGINATLSIAFKMHQRLKASIAPFIPAILALCFFTLIVGIVFVSLLTYLLVAILVVSSVALLVASLLVKLVATIVVIINFNFAVRTISKAWASSSQEAGQSSDAPLIDDLIKSLEKLAHWTLNALHQNYGQLRGGLSGLLSRIQPALGALVVTAAPSGDPAPREWWLFFAQLVAAIVEIDLIACRAVLGVVGATVPFAWSIVGRHIGLPDSLQGTEVASSESIGISSAISL
ncbi:hypothetical protein C0991_001028 [Blastosporella zonata]|nr:hypothetical protein C0991_001028 [Blastosporella zonata]